MRSKQPLFVAREGYRRRRAIDAVRLAPVMGAFLVLLPLLWKGGMTRNGIVYVFAVWAGLIVLAAVLSRRLKEPESEPEKSQQKGPGNGIV